MAGLQDLLDGGQKTIGVGEHDLVELLALGLFDGAALEGFEIEADDRDGSFELVSYGVEEGVLSLVAADFADEEDGVEYDQSDERGEEDDTKDGDGKGALVEDDPGDVEGDGEADGEDAQGDEGGDGSAASGDFHAT